MEHIVGVYTERYENVTASTRVKCHRSSRTGYKPSARRARRGFTSSQRVGGEKRRRGKEKKGGNTEGSDLITNNGAPA